MKYLSVCSGIEAASVAWHPLGWQPWAFSEIEAFPSAVLKHHYPNVPNLGDMTRFQDWPDADIDLLVGGTPCQSFSVAGLRKGLADPRGNLALTFLALVDKYRPRWVVWENVPGVLSATSHDAPDPCPPPPPLDLGRDGAEVETEDEYSAEEIHAFNCLLAGFSELGYFGAYGSLDAQYAGLAQRRLRVFAVFHLGDWRRAAAVLFERESLSGHPAPRREAGETAPTIPSRSTAGGGLGTDFDCDGGLIHCADVAPTLNAHFGDKQGLEDQHAMNGAGLFIAFSAKDYGADAGELAPTLRAGGHDKSHANAGVMPAIAFANTAGDTALGLSLPGAPPITTRNGDPGNVLLGMQVRRLTPLECERLQGFPDGYTAILYRGKPAADGPRYKALGNSMAVPVMAWIGRRIHLVEQIQAADVAA
jgi:DNA (cytosine-5)-methyltransferase 1